MAEDRSVSPILLTILTAVALLSAAYGRGAAKPVPLAGDARPGVDARLARLHSARGWWSVLVQTLNRFSDDRIMTEAAGVTFSSCSHSSRPLRRLFRSTACSRTRRSCRGQLQSIAAVVPAGGMDIIENQVRALAANGRQALSFGVVVGVLTSLWSANQGIKGVFDALNVVYHEKEKRGYITRTILSLCFTFGAILFLVLAMLGIVVLPIALTFVGFEDDTAMLLTLSRWPLLIAVLMVFLSVVYRFWPQQDPGAVALGQLGQRVFRDRLGGRLARLLVLRRQFRQLQPDLRVAGRRDSGLSPGSGYRR